MTAAVALGGWWSVSGWCLAAAALTMALAAWRALGSRGEAVSCACHELRGPITAARLGLELEARRGALTPAGLRAIDLELGRAALALQDLSDAGSPWVGVRAAQMWDDVDVRELLEDSIEAWRAAAARQGVELRLTWLGLPARVAGERLRLAQATGNLIANAIEHGAGPVEVRVRRDGSALRIEVCDRGPGLPAPVAELVERRRRFGGRAPWSGQASDRGRGLRIASAVAVAHGGRLASAPSDSGARLVLELPVSSSALSATPVE